MTDSIHPRKDWNIPQQIKCLQSLCCALLLACFVQGQELRRPDLPATVIKSNLLYDATATFNLGMELRLNRKLTLDIPVSYNPWTYGGEKNLKHWLVQPELRLWGKGAFNGLFCGLHLHAAQFNTTGVIDFYRYEGWLAGVGMSFGYRWNLSGGWGIEMALGAGYAYIDYTKYTSGGTSPEGCRTCGRKLASDIKHYWGPTKIGLSVSYTIGRASVRKPEPSADDIFIPVTTVPQDIRKDQTGAPPPVIRIDTLITPRKLHYHHEAGSAYILFPVDKYGLHPELGNNGEELSEIGRSLQLVRSVSGATIEKITLEAYASPEGDLNHNIELSAKRAEALCDYISETYGIDRLCFTVLSRGENWEGLRTAVSATDLLTSPEKADILRILDLQDLATRKTLLRQYRGGKSYATLLRGVYPLLRTCEYRIDYTVPEKEE